jgi:putative DNA primase/helicase
MLAAALRWARIGKPVFPCDLATKAPLTSHGFKDATRDEEQIREWWRENPDAMIGTPTGKLFVVLDIDLRQDRQIDGYKSLPGWRDLSSVIVQTPSGGAHLYFFSDGTVCNSTDRIAPGVDTRGEGGYVILPPSRNAEGGSYRFLKGSQDEIDDLPPFPPELLAKLDPVHQAEGADDPDADPILIAAALSAIPNDDVGWDDWKRIALATWRATAGSEEGFEAFDKWSQKSRKYDAETTRKTWQDIARSPPTRIGAGTIFYLADQADPDWRERLLVLSPQAPLKTADQFVRREFARDGAACLAYYRGAFYEWMGSHYAECHDANLRSALYEFTSKGYMRRRKKLVPFDPNPGRINAVTDALKALVCENSKKDAPFWLAKEKSHGPNGTDGLIAFRNGMLDITTRKLYPHSPHLFNVNSLPYDYDPDAPKPEKWLNFLLQIWPSKADEETELTLQEIFGLSLTGDTSFQKMFLIVGPKRSGKGTIGRVLGAMLGSANVAAPTLSSLGSEFGLAPLINKRLAIISDARLDARAHSHVVTERLLSISGEDSLDVNRKFRDHWSGQLKVLILMLTNELPRFADVSGALPSRFIVLTMQESFLGREDLGLTKKLLVELPGIVNWSLRGLDRLLRRGYFPMPQKSLDAIQTLEDLSSPVSAFLRQRCVTGPLQQALVRRLYEKYIAWSVLQGHRPCSNIVFGRNLSAALPKLSTQGRHPHRYYVGVGLIEDGAARGFGT